MVSVREVVPMGMDRHVDCVADDPGYRELPTLPYSAQA
mgnify:FL=1